MISIKKYLDTDGSRTFPQSKSGVDDLLPATAEAYRSALQQMGECSMNACPALGVELKRALGRIQEQLSNAANASAVESVETGVRGLLQDWGRNTARHYQQKASEVKDLLLVMARTAESVGNKDERCAEQLDAVTARLKTIASLDDMSEIRASIKESASALKTSIERMTAEGRAVIEHLRVEVCAYQAKLEQAEYVAAFDSMTGLGSRLWVEDRIQHRIDVRSTFCAVVIDIDGFKHVNDEHGHLTGDLLLKQFAAELRSACRSTDIIGRWGGDEFIVVLDCGLQDARAQISRVRDWICGDYSVPGRSGQLKLRLEASVGLAEYRTHETLQELLERADMEMYSNKNDSRRWKTA